MKVTIVIPNYNGEKYLKNCLDSLEHQEYRNFEVVVVDNFSQDKSLEILEGYKQVRLIRLSQNYGFSRAVNEGIKASKGEYIVLLNNDTVATPTWLKELLYAIEQEPQAFSCCSKMLRHDNKSLIDDAGDEYNLLGWSYKRGDGKMENSYGLKDRSVFSSCAGAAIYRKSMLDKVGLFDEHFFAYLEDMDISYRARTLGYKNLYASKARIYHLGSATSGSRYNGFKAGLTARNNIFLIYKNMPLIQLIINLPFLLLGFLIKYLFYAKKGLGKEYSQGLLRGIKELKNISKQHFSLERLPYYLSIELLLIKNIFVMAFKL